MLQYAQLERYEGNEALFDLVNMSVVSTIAGNRFIFTPRGFAVLAKPP